MFDSPAFGVVTGLVLIYLLYSLLVTILGEFLSNLMGLRARILRIGIERMLNDGYYKIDERGISQRFQNFVRRVFLIENPGFRKSFAGKFYSYPSIKYLSKMERDQVVLFGNTKPGYINGENFADTLINLLNEKGLGNDMFARVKFALRFNTLNIQPETAKLLSNHLKSAGTDINDFRKRLITWYAETMDRTTGWYKTKLRIILFFLGFLLAVFFNVDSIHIARSLSKDKQARDQLVNMGVALAKDTSKMAPFLRNADSGKSKAILDSGLSAVTNDIFEANSIIGLGWRFDTLTQSNISKYKKESHTAGDYSFLQKEIAVFATFNRSIRLLDSSLRTLASQKQLASDAIYKLRQDSILAVISGDTKSVSAIRRNAIVIRRRIDVIGEKMKKDSFYLNRNRQYFAEVKKSIPAFLKFKMVSVEGLQQDANEKETILVSGKILYGFGAALGYIFDWRRLLGFVLTAFALSFGAPFWFDLLSKLVMLRGAGVKPDDKAAQDPARLAALNIKEATSAASSIPKDMIEKAVEVYLPALKQIPGVTSVFPVVIGGVKTLQVNVSDANTANTLAARYPVFAVNGVNITYVTQITGSPAPHAVTSITSIANQSARNGHGTLGCVLRSTENQTRHILSCWHVLKGDLKYSDTDAFPIIVDYPGMGTIIAERWAGGIKGPFDYGIARCVPGMQTSLDNTALWAALGIKQGTQVSYRAVTPEDVNGNIPIRFYDSISQTPGVVHGKIFANAPEVNINYADKTRPVSDVLLLTGMAGAPISVGGNSGALVFDNKDRAIAMIIGGDTQYTYAVKLSPIFDLHDDMLIC